MGAAVPPPVPGSIARSQTTVPVTPVFSTLQAYFYTPYPGPTPLTVSTVPGFVSAVFQVRVDVPASIQNLGTPLANGVRQVVVGLQFLISPSSSIPPASNLVTVYLK